MEGSTHPRTGQRNPRKQRPGHSTPPPLALTAQDSVPRHAPQLGDPRAERLESIFTILDLYYTSPAPRMEPHGPWTAPVRCRCPACLCGTREARGAREGEPSLRRHVQSEPDYILHLSTEPKSPLSRLLLACGDGGRVHTELSASPSSQERGVASAAPVV